MPDTQLQPAKTREPAVMTLAPARRSVRRKLSTNFRFWARSTFSRESLISSFKSLLWVAPLTVLIWIYAEREQLVTQPMVGVAIEAPSAEAGRVVSLVGLPGGIVHVELRGPQAGVDQAKEWLESRQVPLEVDHNLSEGEHEINLQAELNQLQQVAKNGVTVERCDPPSVMVNVDPMTDVEVEVRVRPEDLRRLVGPPVFTPSKVKVIGPRSVIAAAGSSASQPGSQFVAYASLKPFSQQLSVPGKHDFSSVPLSVNIDNPHVILSPVTVSATLVVKQADQRLTLPRVRLLQASPPETFATKKYEVVFPQTLTGVTVVGPEEQIAKLRNEEVVPWAVFQPDYLSTEGDHTAPLTFEFPPGVQLSPEDANRTVTYTLKLRPSSE
ncbi:MAG TPA: hypothetical protein VN541_23985 [Tepidisphaeraceae bacterium]|nr:hypothetical protein [Tepidisphaeraceae bacterium]